MTTHLQLDLYSTIDLPLPILAPSDTTHCCQHQASSGLPYQPRSMIFPDRCLMDTIVHVIATDLQPVPIDPSVNVTPGLLPIVTLRVSIDLRRDTHAFAQVAY